MAYVLKFEDGSYWGDGDGQRKADRFDTYAEADRYRKRWVLDAKVVRLKPKAKTTKVLMKRFSFEGPKVVIHLEVETDDPETIDYFQGLA